MNNLNSSSVDVGGGTTIVGAGRKEDVGANRTDVGTLATGVALGLTDRSVVVFGS